MKGYILNKVRGAFEFYLFMSTAVNYFEPIRLREALLSFLIPVFFIPYGIYVLSLTHQTELQVLADLENLQTFTFTEFIFLVLIKGFLSTLFLLAFMYAAAKILDKSEHFYRFVTAGNWAAIPGVVLSLPLMLMIYIEGYGWEVVYFVATLYILYNLAVTAFLTTYTLNIPWELGTALAIFALFIGEAGNSALNCLGEYWEP